ncbi:uncharacterized protein TNCV_1331521 [Trichonephila clavipes]|nr:uncharacterized protein TNCV_1331521 [Trichonephila clavipes]
MTAPQYVYDILQPHVLPFMQRLPCVIFQQDNVRPHTARVSKDCLRIVPTLLWPFRSSDLSPIEHIWDKLEQRVGHPTSLSEPETRKLTFWCALWAGGIIGPYFFKSDEGHNVTVNGDRYIAMITNFFIPELNNHDVQELWFQQDGATCHTARVTIDLLKDTFGDCLFSRFGPVNWPPRSCD